MRTRLQRLHGRHGGNDGAVLTSVCHCWTPHRRQTQKYVEKSVHCCFSRYHSDLNIARCFVITAYFSHSLSEKISLQNEVVTVVMGFCPDKCFKGLCLLSWFENMREIPACVEDESRISQKLLKWILFLVLTWWMMFPENGCLPQKVTTFYSVSTKDWNPVPFKWSFSCGNEKKPR